MNKVKKIVVIGPESTGKSMLCSQLSTHYNTLWVQEYAREYLLRNGTNYSFEQLLEIAKGQLELEQQGMEKLSEIRPMHTGALPLFIDTDMYVMKVWCEFVFGQCHSWILDRLVEQSYDLYLFANIDIPWVKDELREYPDLATREKLYHHYKDALVHQDVSWVDISGNYQERLEKAIAAVDKLLMD
jgi:NadR type nicotinamide-nucleotide adenylyltransferase